MKGHSFLFLVFLLIIPFAFAKYVLCMILYDATTQSNGAVAAMEVGVFTVQASQVPSVDPNFGSEGDQISIKRMFFGTKKGKVYLEKDGVKKACKIIG